MEHITDESKKEIAHNLHVAMTANKQTAPAAMALLS